MHREFRTLIPRVACLAAAAAIIVGVAGCGGGTRPSATTVTTAAVAPATGQGDARGANAVLTALASAADGVAAVMAKPDPASSTWRGTLSTRLDALAQVDAQAKALRPTSAENETHQRLLEITADFSRAAQLIRTSIDPVNAENLDQAAQILGTGVTKVAALRATLPAQ